MLFSTNYVDLFIEFADPVFSIQPHLSKGGKF